MSHPVCQLCGLEITSSEESLGYSDFIENKEDEFYSYSPSSFHRVCFNTWDRKGKFLERFDQYIKETKELPALKEEESDEEIQKELEKKQKSA